MQGILNDKVALQRVIDATAAGTTPINGNGVDLGDQEGYDGVLFILAVGALTATQLTSMKAQASDDNGASDAYADIANSNTQTLQDADNNKLLLLDVYRPPKQWVRPIVNRGTADAVVDGVIAVRYNASGPPTVHDASTVAGSTVAAEEPLGTA